jgi:hypothetical protein
MLLLAGIVMVGLCLIVWILIAYGTHAKTNWGINKHPVFCPRCNTQLPAVRQPQSLRQAMWGGWTCMVCGIEVDKWGRELASVGPRRRRFVPPDQYRKVAMKRIMLVFMATAFCGLLLLHLLKLRGSRFPFNEVTVLTAAGLALVETSIGALIFYFYMRRLFRRFSPEVKGPDTVRANESGRTPKV